MFYALLLSLLSSIFPGVEEIKNDFDHDHPTIVEIRDVRDTEGDVCEACSFAWGG